MKCFVYNIKYANILCFTLYHHLNMSTGHKHNIKVTVVKGSVYLRSLITAAFILSVLCRISSSENFRMTFHVFMIHNDQNSKHAAQLA
jgi:hypothetical protein